MQPLFGIARLKHAQVSEPALAEDAVRGQRKRFRCQHRLIKHEVVALLRDGARFKRAELLIKFAENGFGQARIAIAVPKRLLKLAIDRNRVKRVIREVFRQNLVRTRPVDLLVTLRSEGTLPSSERRNSKQDGQQLRQSLTLLLADISQRVGASAE